MIKLSVTRTLSLLTVVLLASLAVVLYTSIRQSNNVKEASQSVSHTEKVLLQLKKMVLLAYENETGSRGFIITGQQKFLEPLHRAEKDFHTQLTTLRQLLANSNTHKQHLDSLEFYIRKRIDYSRLTVTTRMEEGLAAAMQLVESGQGKLYSDKIMELGNRLEALELSALQQKKAARNQKLFNLNLILYGILLGMLVLAIAFLYNIRNEIRRRKETNHELELLNKQLNEAHDAIYVVDANRKITSWNKGAAYLYGYSRQEAIGKDSNVLLQTVISNNELSKVLEEISKTDYWTGEIKRLTKAGKTVYVRSSSTTIRNEKGIITGYVVVNVDITLQKELSAQLRHLATLVEHSSDAIMSRGMDKRFISWNEGSEKLLGYTKEEAIGKTALELGMIRFLSAEFDDMENAINEYGSWKGEKQYYHKNGHSFTGDVTANAVKDEDGNLTSLVFIIKDISLRKNLEEQLRLSNIYLEERIRERSYELSQSEKRFRLLIEHSAEGIALTDEHSNLIYRSPAAYRITGYTTDEFAIGLAHPDDLPIMQANFAEALKNPGQPVEFIARVQHATGHFYWCEGTLTSLLHVDGINAVVANFRDVTLRKVSEQKLKASEEQFRNT
ncbi:MAG: PAS domain S-box protein, partial [Chitinophagaceae bacterium]|nr:PAS domain S-box protein [Chitinophagaceae bacterium]